MVRLVDTDIKVGIFTREDSPKITPENLNNTRIWINGHAYILVVEEPDDTTYLLLGMKR